MRKSCLIIVVQILVMVELTGPSVLPPCPALFFTIALTTIGHILYLLVSFLPLPPNIHTIEYQLHRAEILSVLFSVSKYLEKCEVQRRCSSTVK